MVFIKTEEEIELIRKSSLLVAKAHAEVARMIKPGITSLQLDTIAEEFILDNGGIPAFKGYNGFPNTLCISPNEQVVHGIPNNLPLTEGTVLSVDCGVLMNDYYGDSAYTYTIGEVDDDILNFLDENTFQINPTISGTYGVTAFYEYNGDLCISNTAYENFAIIQTGFQDIDDINFSYYQIDKNFLVIDFESNKENNINVDMFGSFGKVVYNNKEITVNQYIPINELVNGVYYIRLIINNKFVSTKSIIIN